jgi:hypothetical protein
MSITEHSDSDPNGTDENDSSGKGHYRLEERAMGLFLLGIVLFNPLMLSVFDRGAEAAILGVPLLFVYIFCAWTLLIVLLACTVETGVGSAEPDDDDDLKQPKPPGGMS